MIKIIPKDNHRKQDVIWDNILFGNKIHTKDNKSNTCLNNIPTLRVTHFKYIPIYIPTMRKNRKKIKRKTS